MDTARPSPLDILADGEAEPLASLELHGAGALGRRPPAPSRYAPGARTRRPCLRRSAFAGGCGAGLRASLPGSFGEASRAGDDGAGCISSGLRSRSAR
ncbi:MAG: hypothetical protein MZV65_01160 [Chromatiales bacterium]|nr:hypothetical protein [Chromatiales bacterium]